MTASSRRLWSALAISLVIAAPLTARAQIAGLEDMASGATPLYARVRVAGFASLVELHQSGLKTRVDVMANGGTQTYIADREKGVLITLTAGGANRVALVFPLDRAEGIVPLPLDLSVLTRQATLKVVGASLVSGRSCRLMEFTGYLNQSGMICATPDNIILQMTKQGRHDPLFEVQDLTIGPQDPKWFRTPPDYQVAVVPGIGGASATGEGAMVTQPLPPVGPTNKTPPGQ